MRTNRNEQILESHSRKFVSTRVTSYPISPRRVVNLSSGWVDHHTVENEGTSNL